MRSSPLLEVVKLMFWLGLTAFGGPAAHIALLREAVVKRRGWVTEARFLDYLGLVNLIPGPNSTEMVMHVSLERAGWRGLLLGGAAFIVPAASLTLLFAVLFERFGSSPIGTGVLIGVYPVVIAVVAQAIWGLASAALKHSSLIMAAALACVGYVLGLNELLILIVIAGAHFALTRGASKLRALEPITLTAILLLFLKIGATLYGSGYVLLAYLKNEFVLRGWLTEAQLLAAVAIGQVTPGPVFSSATFVGYLMAGIPGAILATIGIFAPAFFFVWITHPLLERLRQLEWTSKLLDAVNAAALGLMLGVTITLARDALRDVPTVLIALVSSVLLVRFKVNSTWLVLGGAMLGLVFYGRV
jgi:chromate transporter